MIKTNQCPGGKQIEPIKCVVYAISQAANENREWNPANCLMRGKKHEWWSRDWFSFAFRLAEGWWEFSGPQSEAKYNQWDPTLLLTHNWKLLFWYLYCSNVFFSFPQAIIESLGAERRNRVLSGLYMGRSDVSLMVRQAALHVWKVVVPNTPRILREILPTLFSLLLGCLASTSYDKRQVSVAC